MVLGVGEGAEHPVAVHLQLASVRIDLAPEVVIVEHAAIVSHTHPNPTRRVPGFVGGSPTVLPMRLLHTSDWHLGRSLHRADLRAAQAAFLDELVAAVKSERIDAVLVCGDVYDRAVPSLDAVQLCEDALVRLRDAGARVVVISGNHDSATRLGFSSTLVDASGSTCAPIRLGSGRRCCSPTLPGAVGVYALPYLEPESARVQLPADPSLGRSRSAVATPGSCGRAMDCVRADRAARGLARAVVMAHAWVAGGASSESERDISVGRRRAGGSGDFRWRRLRRARSSARTAVAERDRSLQRVAAGVFVR